MKKVLITGASRGIGNAAAQKFLQEGWAVIGTSTTGTAPSQHQAFRMYALNLLDPESIKKFTAAMRQSEKTIDLLVNNAGISDNDDVAESVSIKALRKTLEVNLIGLIDLTERLLPLIREGGHIINISSGLSSLVQGDGSYAPAYGISKAALNKYTVVLAHRLQAKGITVSAFDPGWVRTDMGGSGAQRDPSEPARELFKLAASKVDSGCFWHRGKKRSW
jgi:NAD(P)-dependent dehydrogenase (short-subunit alcohol dehydrogenase family)